MILNKKVLFIFEMLNYILIYFYFYFGVENVFCDE